MNESQLHVTVIVLKPFIEKASGRFITRHGQLERFSLISTIAAKVTVT